MNAILIDSLGYLAIAINLYSMSAAGEYKLRLISLIANVLFVIYGVLIGALPVVVGCTIAVILHAYHIRRLTMENASND